MNKNEIIKKCYIIKNAFKNGQLGDTTMPEDTHPNFSDNEDRFVFFSLPMSLNYQRNSFKLWEAATRTFNDKKTNQVYLLDYIKNTPEDDIRPLLLKYKLALQPNKHINTWKRIGTTVFYNWKSFTNLFKSTKYDFLKLKQILQKDYKKGFPYLSGPKIFNYWSYIMEQYGDIKLKNSEYIEIAPDTHVIQASIKLGLISKEESRKISREGLSKKWRHLLKGTNINPIDTHSPLWFWSRSNFSFEL